MLDKEIVNHLISYLECITSIDYLDRMAERTPDFNEKIETLIETLSKIINDEDVLKAVNKSTENLIKFTEYQQRQNEENEQIRKGFEEITTNFKNASDAHLKSIDVSSKKNDTEKNEKLIKEIYEMGMLMEKAKNQVKLN